MRQTVILGRLFDIRVGVHVSWILIFAFMTLSIAPNISAVPRVAALGLAAVCALSLFASVIVHELAHALVARRFAVRTSAITLFLFGGVATLEREPPTPRAEACIALAGPLMSALLAGLAFAGLALVEHWGRGPLGQALGRALAYLALANGVLAAFNLVPAFPMDGGRVVRAVVWQARHSRAAATGAAAIVGLVVAAAMIIAGVVLVVRLHSWQAAWYSLLGTFLLRAAWLQFTESRASERLERVRLGAEVVAAAAAGALLPAEGLSPA